MTQNIQIDYKTMCVSKSMKWLKEKESAFANQKMKSLFIENFILDSHFFSSFASTSVVRLFTPSQSADMGLSTPAWLAAAGGAPWARRSAAGIKCTLISVQSLVTLIISPVL